MFYKKGYRSKVSQFSHLSFEKIFTGTYWDEFAIGAQLHPSQSLKILFLGVADGAGIRPIFASSKNIDLIAVDLNEQSLKNAKSLYSEIFPDLKFKIHCADAAQYLEQSKESFDLIYIDLYTETRYADVNFSTDFYKALRTKLNSGGILLQNAFGLPMHLGALKKHGPQHEVLAQHLKIFTHTYGVPYRRNLTLISMQNLPVVEPASIASGLILEDRIYLESLRTRLAHMRKFTLDDISSVEAGTPYDVSYNDMGTAMLASWSVFLDKLRSVGTQFSHLKSTRDIAELLKTPELAFEAMLAFIKAEYSIEASAIPALYAGEQNLGKVATDKFLDLVFANWKELKNLNSAFVNEYMISQMVAIVISNPAHRQHLFKLREKIL